MRRFVRALWEALATLGPAFVVLVLIALMVALAYVAQPRVAGDEARPATSFRR